MTAAADAPARGPLDGLRVIDLTVVLSGPYATQIFGDLGAEVIKVELPEGDNGRSFPQHFVGPDSVYFASSNRNKSSIVIDIRRSEGQALLDRLVAKADVLVENARPGTLARYGVSWEQLRGINPALVMCSISGFGQTGPYRERPAYDMIVQALSGGMSLTGEEDGLPVRSGIAIADISAGLYAVIGILAALQERQRTGVGRYIDLSMLDCQVAMLSYQAANCLYSGEPPGRQGSGHSTLPTYRSFTAGDGRDFVVCAVSDRMWTALCELTGLTELRDDPGLKTGPQRHARRQEIWTALECAFRTRSAGEWVTALMAAGVPVAEVKTVDRALDDPQVRHRDMVVELAGGDGRKVRVAGNPLKFEGAVPSTHRFPPMLGEHTRDICRRLLGMTDAEIDTLTADGVLAK